MIGAALAVLLSASATETAAASPPRGPGRRPILFVMESVVESLIPHVLAGPAPEPRRLSVRDGLLGISGYDPPGWTGGGPAAPPRNLLPRAGAGNSLNQDPVTGRSYFTNLP